MQSRSVRTDPRTDLAPYRSPLPVRLRAATLADFDVMADLIRLIDLNRHADELAPIFEILRDVLAAGRGGEGPFTHGSLHFVVADLADQGTPIGLIRCGVGSWTGELAVPAFIRSRLYSRIGNVQELAVAPGYQGRGIARALLRRIEEDHRDAGYDAMVLRHHREQTSFYTHAGYTSGSRLTLVLPNGLGTVSVPGQSWRWAVKPLAQTVAVANIQGRPALTGLLGPRDSTSEC